VGVALDLRTVRTQRYRLTYEAGSKAGELYDLQEDPHEMVNRFDDAGHAAIQRELLDMIASENPDSRSKPVLPVVGTA
jgi:arylsulfatase A-like enzyme